MSATDVPKQIGPYEILGPLGKGGMGAVYKAMQPSLNRIVAIKVLPADFAKDPDSVARFHREAQTVAMLSHPNIVQIIDKGEDQGILYFAMEYVEGTSLDVVLRQRRLSLQEVVQIIKQIGRGLGAAHRAGLVLGAGLRFRRSADTGAAGLGVPTAECGIPRRHGGATAR